MEIQTNQSLENQIVAVLKARPEILQPIVEEYVEDLLFGKMIEEGKTGISVSENEVMKILKE